MYAHLLSILDNNYVVVLPGASAPHVTLKCDYQDYVFPKKNYFISWPNKMMNYRFNQVGTNAALWEVICTSCVTYMF